VKHDSAMRLLEAVGEISDSTVRDALPPERSALPRILRRAACAAAAAVFLGIGAAVLPGRYSEGMLPSGTSSTGSPTLAADDSSDTSETTEAQTGIDEPGMAFAPVTSYVSPIAYSGPILPLTADRPSNIGDSIRSDYTVVRQLTVYMDTFVEEEREAYAARTAQGMFTVTDCYVIENHSDEALTLTLYYPVIASYADDASLLPTVKADNRPIEPTVYAGAYAGGFSGGAQDDVIDSLNITAFDSPDEYESLLADGGYRADALAAKPISGVTADQLKESNAAYRRDRTNYYSNVPRRFIFEAVPEALMRRSVSEALAQYGPDGASPIDRWTLDAYAPLSQIIDDVRQMKRVFYSVFTVTIPADGGTIVFFQMERPASYDHRDMRVGRIDALPKTDTNFYFTGASFILLKPDNWVITSTTPPLDGQHAEIRGCKWCHVDFMKKE